MAHNQPFIILGDSTQRTQGRDAQSMNIAAGKAVAESVRTTLGPRGMDKMLVTSSGDVIITNDGATILKQMDIEHPAAQMIVEVSESQEEEVGDGTTTAAVIAGQLLAKAEKLLEDDVHPTTIVEGYSEANQIAQEAITSHILSESLDDKTLQKVATTSMTGKGTGDVSPSELSKIIVDAVKHVAKSGNVNRDDIHLQTRVGASSSATELVKGFILESERAHENMPKSVSKGKVLILDMDLEIRDPEVDAEFTITSVDQLTAAFEAEEAELRDYADTISKAGVNVVFCTEDIDNRVAGFLSDKDILAFEDVSSDDAKALSRATGAMRVATLHNLSNEDLGTVDSLEIQKFNDDELTFVEAGSKAEAVTVFLRGGTEHIVDELERAVSDGLDVVTAAVESGEVVPGAGVVEIGIASRVRSVAASIEGRKQLAVEAFADAVEVIPRTLAENAGLDQIDTLVDLRAANDSGRAGIIAKGESGELADPVKHGILDPAAVKREAIDSATEAATMIIRIDDIIAAS
ncbi:MAG TPA: thermosome subunit [Halobacteriales archaeon]|uniref:thermosome subunit alpha n=1 Tax=Candidatus Hikarchaeum yamanae TaxID=2675326 RepID=UPI0017AE36E5|nr:thermosome subunit [Halobacteriales archaeon]|tara:strand:- start:107111 stop:108670 length:1560 start_codon:yes stop_codon:yes gene_type:complete